MITVGFFVRHFTERGTEIAIYDYAKYNEEILKNKSCIICLSEYGSKLLNFPYIKLSYEKFNKRFMIITIDKIEDMENVIKFCNINYFYTLTQGSNDIYDFNNKKIWQNCKTIKHAVFSTLCNESDFYISISDFLNKKNNTTLKVIPHIVNTHDTKEHLRTELNIPSDALVLGRYGGFTEFNLNFVHEAIKEYLNLNKNTYFIFMNTQNFYIHPKIIYLNSSLDLEYKTKFINTCDFMLHARIYGETFGLSIAEFSIKNKPIITCNCGDLEHIKILGDKAIIYNTKEELLSIFLNLQNILNSRTDWNSYSYYSPENIMNLFNLYIFN